MADVLIHQAHDSTEAPIDAAKWDDPLLISGGENGQAAVMDSTSPQGASWGWLIPAAPVTSYDQIPLGQVRVYFGGTPEKLALVYNNNGTYVEMSVTI